MREVLLREKETKNKVKKILVIDDEELLIKSLRKLLEKEGFVVFVVKSGEDALIMVEEESFDLIIADIRMPGINGLRTVQTIYENLKNKNLKRIPVMFITGYADEEIEREASTLKPLAYIHKPFDIARLVSKVKEFLK